MEKFNLYKKKHEQVNSSLTDEYNSIVHANRENETPSPELSSDLNELKLKRIMSLSRGNIYLKRGQIFNEGTSHHLSRKKIDRLAKKLLVVD